MIMDERTAIRSINRMSDETGKDDEAVRLALIECARVALAALAHHVARRTSIAAIGNEANDG